jgi:hypothetical protein
MFCLTAVAGRQVAGQERAQKQVTPPDQTQRRKGVKQLVVVKPSFMDTFS